MKIIQGDIIQEALKVDFIAHGCNCFCTKPYAGIAALYHKIFNIGEYSYEQPFYKGKYNKLGNLEYVPKFINTETLEVFDIEQPTLHKVFVCNAYTQFQPGRDLDWNALILCFKKMEYVLVQNKWTAALPLIGGGIAGGDLKTIIKFMEKIFVKSDVTLVLDAAKYKEYLLLQN